MSACSLGEIAVPKTASTIVVHGVLNANADNQVVLLERTLTGTVKIRDSLFNPAEPIISDGGIPISGATVDIITPSGQLVHGVEDRTVSTNHLGAGVYRFALPGTALLLGRSYALRIKTPQGEEASASTLLPGTRSVALQSRIPLNRDHDTLDLRWSPVPLARSYGLRIDGPFGPFFLFTDSLHLRFNGELRNLFSENLPRVFIPGFSETILLTAVDSNFYDYYRTQNDPFTGSGIISRVTGGIGVFGSMANVIDRVADVTADLRDSVEGRFLYPGPTVSPAGNAPAVELSLYVESPSLKAGAPAALSGNYTTPSRQRLGLLGTRLGQSITLAFLTAQTAFDTTEVFTGTLKGDSLIGAYRNRNGKVVFIKAR